MSDPGASFEERLYFALRQLALVETALMGHAQVDVAPEGYEVNDCAAEAVRAIRHALEPLRSAPFAVMNYKAED